MTKEKRYPRARFTRALEKLCRNLMDGPFVRPVQTRSIVDNSIKIGEVQINALWVAGSYARGATECGDLDLIIDARSIKGPLPYAYQIARGFFGSNPGVAFYSGTPEENTSGVAFPEARLIWSTDHTDWQTQLASIALCTEAGRFARPSDRLPLSTRQFRGDNEDVDELLALYEAEILQWHFIPFDVEGKMVSELPSKIERQLKVYGFGKRTCIALRHFFAVTSERWCDEFLHGDVRSGFRIKGVSLQVGVPSLPSSSLRNINIFQEVLLPYLSARGPNGAWVIERGSKHPLVLLANKYQAFVLADKDTPITISDYDTDVRMIELYTSRELAQESADDWNENPDDDAFQVMAISGKILLDAFAGVECVSICNTDGQTRVQLSPSTDSEKFCQEIFSYLPLK